MKPSTGFLEDYKRLVDFMSFNRISGVTIYGFLRDNHGGIEATKELCHYAKERGVRILPGVGINAYGAFIGKGAMNITSQIGLKRIRIYTLTLTIQPTFPFLNFQNCGFRNHPTQMLFAPRNLKILPITVKLLLGLPRTLILVVSETGDYGACSCDECTKRREEDSTWSIQDMQLLYPELFKAAKSKKEDLWLVIEMYWDNILNREKNSPSRKLAG